MANRETMIEITCQFTYRGDYDRIIRRYFNGSVQYQIEHEKLVSYHY